MVEPNALASLYIHIPFCKKKCPYCHFFVLKHAKDKEAEFVAALKKEWDLRKEHFKGKTLTSIYFGGGTPTQLSSRALNQILLAIKQSAHVSPDCEITLEANPEDLIQHSANLKAYRASGFNRLSIGVQSFDNELLKALGREHSALDAQRALTLANGAGFENISIDLMYETPHQTLESWEKTLQTASKQPITHISLYNLTFEPGAKFFRIQDQLTPHLPTEDAATRMFLLCDEVLSNASLKRYEISAFAKEGYQSRHNLGYWQGRPFIGLGPSAFSYWERQRFQNVANFPKYLDDVNRSKLPTDFIDSISPSAHQKEMLAVGLRPLEGVERAKFEAHYGPFDTETLKALKRLEEDQLITINSEQKISLTPRGRLFHDSVAMQLIEA